MRTKVSIPLGQYRSGKGRRARTQSPKNANSPQQPEEPRRPQRVTGHCQPWSPDWGAALKALQCFGADFNLVPTCGETRAGTFLLRGPHRPVKPIGTSGHHAGDPSKLDHGRSTCTKRLVLREINNFISWRSCLASSTLATSSKSSISTMLVAPLIGTITPLDAAAQCVCVRVIGWHITGFATSRAVISSTIEGRDWRSLLCWRESVGPLALGDFVASQIRADLGPNCAEMPQGRLTKSTFTATSLDSVCWIRTTVVMLGP